MPKNNKNNSMKELNDKIFQELEEFTEGISYPDDTALMSVRIF